MICDEFFGERLKKLRGEKGMSQMELAKAALIAPAQLYRYESNRMKPRTVILLRLANALNTSAEWLADGSIPMYSANKVTLQLPPRLAKYIEVAAGENELTFEEQCIEFIRIGLLKDI